MVLFFLITFLIIFCLAYARAVLFYLHMFQLNGYKPNEQVSWIIKNRKKTVPLFIALILAVCALLIPMGAITMLFLFMPVFLIFSFCYRQKNAKKPLVFTARVKRLLVTVSLVTLAVLAVMFLFHGINNIIFAAFILYFLSPFVILLANLINKPVELSVNRYYINDAKKILKSMPDLTIIGVTGSYGKTSVKFYLNTLLRAKFNVLMTPESYNTPMGIVKTIRGQLRATHEIFICEMGARYIREIKEICDIVHPKHGLITSIGPQHLETFGSIENIVKTKFELADSLPSGGMLFLNGDNDLVRTNNKNSGAIFYGIDSGNKYSASDLKVSERGTEFSVTAPDGETCCYITKLIGRHNVTNILGAIAVSHSLGISLKELVTPVRKLECVPHRLELNIAGNTVMIDDAYNSNPNGTKVALDTLSYFDGIKIIVTPGMIELGPKQDEYNYEFGKDISAVCDYAVLVGEKQTKSIHKGILDSGYAEDKVFVAANLNEALGFVNGLPDTGKRKIVLLENDLPDNY